ncbi:MAG TPA: hypothetical protein VIS56_00945, partial [Candidatus Saccharimonadales bacterium]
WFGRNHEAGFVATLVSRETRLTIMAGRPSEAAHWMTYRRTDDDIFVPLESHFLEGDPPHGHRHAFRENYGYWPPDGKPGSVPLEFRAAEALNDMADTIMGGLDRRIITVRSNLTSEEFGDLRGREIG